MVRLPVKLQFREYEPGEFESPEVLSYQEATQAVIDFPWHEQDFRLHNITGPSVTIKRTEGTYLKIGKAYDDSFLAYYCNKRGKLYSRGFDTMEELSLCIKEFYDNSFDIKTFKKNFWVFSATKHFRTKSFIYKLTPRRILYRLSFPIIFSCMLVPMIITTANSTSYFPLSLSLIMLSIFVLPSIALFINYYRHSYKRQLILSRGKDFFYWGKLHDIKEYKKEDITSITEYHVANLRNPWSEYVYIKITISTKEEIFIPNLLLNESDITYKLRLPNIISREEKYLPFIHSKI